MQAAAKRRSKLASGHGGLKKALNVAVLMLSFVSHRKCGENRRIW
jgi:hypothetical protein